MTLLQIVASRPTHLWRLLLALALAAVLVAATITGCQRRLKPPPASPKPRDYHAAAIPAAPAADAAEAPGHGTDGATRPAVAAVKPPAPDGPSVPRPPRATPAALRMPAPAPPYDPAHPCFNTTQMERAGAVLYPEDAAERAGKWLDAINLAFSELKVPCRDEAFLVLVLTTIQLESAVTVDPALENPNLAELFTYQLAQYRRENPVAGRLLNYSGLDDALRAKLAADTRTGHVRTERALGRYVENDLRVWLEGYLRTHYFLPEGVARYAAEQGMPNPVRTIGPMQVNLRKAFENARARGEPVRSEAQMREWLFGPRTALARGVKEGVYQLWRIYHYYRRRLSAPDAVRFTTADYNAGEFSSRNAAFQDQVAVLTRRKLALDGDLLVYQDGRPAERASNTEAAVITLLSEYAAPNVRRDLLLEKTEAFTATHTARTVCALFRKRTGEPCAAAVVPVDATNAVARVKLGRDYTPVNYSRAYVHRWSQNLERFGAG